MNYLKLKRFSHHLQVSFNRLNVICSSLYKLYAPDGLKHHKNVDQTKLPDSSILAMLIWQTEIGIESQRRFCKFFVGLSHSRFNRRARMLLPLIRCIRQAWNQEVKTAGEFLIIDSFPVPGCQPVRNYRVKIFRGVADIGYKATKKVYYYGFNNLCNVVKLSFLPTGYAPVVDNIFTGLWYMAAPLAMYFVPTQGSGMIGELLAAIVEMAIGGQWGALTIFEGLIQGATNEIGFFPKKERYERFSWKSVLTGAFFANLGGFIPSYFLFGWSHYSAGLQVAMFITSMISALLFDGVLVKLITNLFDKTLAPKTE